MDCDAKMPVWTMKETPRARPFPKAAAGHESVPALGECLAVGWDERYSGAASTRHLCDF